MSESGLAMSYTLRAGRLLRLLAWLILVFNLAILGAGAVPLIALGARPMLFALVLAGLIGIVVALFVVAAGLKRHRPWARLGGIGVSAISLAYFPIGTLIGAVSLFYLYKGWNESPSVA